MSTETSNTLTEKAEAAFRQAAAKVVERARQTGTPVIVWEEGRIAEKAAEGVEKGKEPRKTRKGERE
jgi:hypothetical protein